MSPLLRAAAAVVAAVSLTACAEEPPPEIPGVHRSTGELGGVLAGGAVSARQWDVALAAGRQSTLRIDNYGCQIRATGSGIALDDDHVLTNHHVVEGAHRLTVTDRSGQKHPVLSWVIAKNDDLALLTIPTGSLGTSVTFSKREVVPGDLAAAMGYPLGGPFRVGRGRVLDFDSPDGTTGNVIEASMDILPGNSGGPLLDSGGHLIGIIRAINLESGSAIAIPAARAIPLRRGLDVTPGRPC